MNANAAFDIADPRFGKGTPIFCVRCGRQLTDKESMARKIGPECLKKMGADEGEEGENDNAQIRNGAQP